MIYPVKFTYYNILHHTSLQFNNMKLVVREIYNERRQDNSYSIMRTESKKDKKFPTSQLKLLCFQVFFMQSWEICRSPCALRRMTTWNMCGSSGPLDRTSGWIVGGWAIRWDGGG